MDVSQAISSWYRKETYLKTYSDFIQRVSNMEIWPKCRNPMVEQARQMPGRPPKNRGREIGEQLSSLPDGEANNYKGVGFAREGGGGIPALPVRDPLPSARGP
ncbi:hypothetical protein MTR67_026748 [Solanum verrucosum]|uniref:Uncharacterized protein n=1 Tax=Solanum verrucosum TaxID=315347 RepID=A0AAF0R3J0_SOLVR|nr:hypothetical protein MTR67_026748 [Solanum verrucosum]